MMDVARGFVEESEPFHPAMPEALRRALLDRAREMEHQDMAANRLIGAHGAGLLLPDSRVMTYCNAGSLATVFYGTALGVIYSAFDQGKVQQVYVCETRPVGQGARLTAWELAQAGVPATLICDNMAASLMAQGKVDAVIVGADRICANGDVVNKIGTYGLAVLAKHHGLPFYVAAPHSSFDLSLEHGGQVTIEERNAAEVATSVPEGVAVYNPAFDRTPADLLTAFITDQGIMHPGKECLARAFRT
jgi:methylthioribose-1-phosphate isomerase